MFRTFFGSFWSTLKQARYSWGGRELSSGKPPSVLPVTAERIFLTGSYLDPSVPVTTMVNSFSCCHPGRIIADVTTAAGARSELGSPAFAGTAVGAVWGGGGASEPSPVLAGVLWGVQWSVTP